LLKASAEKSSDFAAVNAEFILS